MIGNCAMPFSTFATFLICFHRFLHWKFATARTSFIWNQAKKDDPFYSDLLKMERNGVKDVLEPDLSKMNIYTGFLKNVKGLGALTSAQLIAIVV